MPRLRVMPTPCLKAPREGAVIRTPCAPPLVPFLTAEGKVKADIELQPLSAINDIFDRLEHGKVAGRVVLDFIGTKADNQKAKAPAAKKTEAAFID